MQDPWQPPQQPGQGQPPHQQPPGQGQPPHQQPPGQTPWQGQQPPQWGGQEGQQSWQSGALPGQPQPQWQQWTGGQHRRPSARRSRKGLLIALSGGGVVVVVAVVLILFFALGGGPGGGGDYREAWTASTPEGEKPGTLLDAYVAGDVLVRATASGVTAYGLDDGEEVWTFKPPSGQQLCTISPSAPADTAVVAYGPPGKAENTATATGRQCTEAAAINVTTGKQAWKAELQRGSTYQVPVSASATVIQGVAVVSNGRVTALDLKTGEQRWTIGPADAGKCRSGDTLASDKVLLATVDCIGKGMSELDDILVSINPADGSGVWKANLKNEGDGAFPPSLLNVSPPVVRLESATGKPEVGVLDDQGKSPRVFPAVDKSGEGLRLPHNPLTGTQLASDNGHKRYPVVVRGNTLIGFDTKANVVGMDLATGKLSWQKSLGESATGSFVAGGDQVTVYTYSEAEGQEWLSTVDPGNGTVTKGPVVRSVGGDSEDGSFANHVTRGVFLTSGDTVVEVAGTDSSAPEAVTAYRRK